VRRLRHKRVDDVPVVPEESEYGARIVKKVIEYGARTVKKVIQ
jgi:hypothetical protein